MRLRRGLFAGLMGLLLVMVGVPVALGANATVTFPEDQDSQPYTPSDRTIAPGESVTFTGGFANHPLEWIDGDFDTESNGSTRTYVFPRPGTYRFICDFHSDMFGRVLVAGGAASADRRAPTARLTGAGSRRAIRVKGGAAIVGLRLDEAATISATLRAGKWAAAARSSRQAPAPSG